MGMYKYLKKTYKTEEYKKLMKERVISWNKEPVMVKLKKPTKIDRARTLGYKAKKGFIVVRGRIRKGTQKRETPSGGRKPLKAGKTKHTPAMNLQHVLETRVGRKHPNLEVLNSYYIGESGKHIWFEVIMIDPNEPGIKNDKQMKKLAKQKGRVYRGLTAAGKKSRGLGKGQGFEK